MIFVRAVESLHVDIDCYLYPGILFDNSGVLANSIQSFIFVIIDYGNHVGYSFFIAKTKASQNTH